MLTLSGLRLVSLHLNAARPARSSLLACSVLQAFSPNDQLALYEQLEPACGPRGLAGPGASSWGDRGSRGQPWAGLTNASDWGDVPCTHIYVYIIFICPLTAFQPDELEKETRRGFWSCLCLHERWMFFCPRRAAWGAVCVGTNRRHASSLAAARTQEQRAVPTSPPPGYHVQRPGTVSREQLISAFLVYLHVH